MGFVLREAFFHITSRDQSCVIHNQLQGEVMTLATPCSDELKHVAAGGTHIRQTLCLSYANWSPQAGSDLMKPRVMYFRTGHPEAW